MESIRREENILFQKSAADHLCILMDLALAREPSPNPKIIANLVTYLCSDNGETGLECSSRCKDESSGGRAGDEVGGGILSLSSLTLPEIGKKLTKQVGF